MKTTPHRTPAARAIAQQLVALAFVCLAIPSAAQTTPETVRGRVIDDSSRVLIGAAVTITRGPDRLVQTATTDSAGRYSSRFEPGTGDYLVYVSAVGYRPARRRVQRMANERELVADFTLARDLTLLQAVKVVADKPVRASNSASPFTAETGASEAWASGVNGQVLPGARGDMNAIAGTIPGVTMTPGGPTMLGAAPTSNLVTLNGMAMAGGTLPRAARMETRVTGATYDATRGGFSGANIDSRLSGGDRFFQRRNGFVTLDAPVLQVTDAIGRSLGLVNGGFRASLGADGEAIRRVLTYNVALDVGRTVSNPSTLVGGDTDAWRRAGVAVDSVARVTQVAGTLGIPVVGSGAPTARTRETLSWLGRIDDVRDSLRTLALTTYVTGWREGAVGFGPLVAPVSGGSQSERALGGLFLYSQYLGPLNNWLMQNRIGASQVRTTSDPYLNAPGASVLVRSSTDAATNDVASLQLGGNPWLATDDTRWTLEGSNELIWNARGSKHRFKTQLWARGDGLAQTGLPNSLGQYTFNSLQDFATNRPASYTRTIAQPDRRATAWNSAAAISHTWNKSRYFSLLYGARVEGNMFGNAPAANTALASALGVRSDVAPARVHVSPRVGFSYVFSRSKENGNGTFNNGLGSVYRTTMGYIRGGVGEFRDLYRPTTLADAIAGTGLAGSTLTLSCVGAAVPLPNWQTLQLSGAPLPTSCADGGAALAERAPSVTLVDPSFDVPRSWRASLNIGTMLGKWLLKIDALGSYDLSQPSTLDANFRGTPLFTLGEEGARPMFVSSSAIDATTGAVSARESRRSTDFGRVALRTSDLRGYGGQLTTTIQPDMFRLRTRVNFYTSASYTLQSVKQQFRGFDGATFGDPRAREWAAGTNDARHAFVLQAGVGIPKVGSFTLFSRVQSGLPFTPLVQSDINGDGRANDRAFIPALATTANTDPTSADAQLRALLAASPANVQRCIESQLSAVAARNSCRGAWTQQLNMQWTPILPIRVRGRRVTSNVIFENPLGGLDQLLHGERNLRGWGTRAAPDPVLLVPRSFDARTQRFRYDVNPRFGDTRAFRTLSRQPFRVTIDFSLDFSVPYDVQQLRRAVEPIKRKNGWERRGADSIAEIYLQRTSNLHRLLLAESDSIFLTAPQISALLRADSTYSDSVRALYRGLGQFLAGRPEGAVGKIELDSVTAATKTYWPLFWDQVDLVEKILTPQQRELLPFIRNMMQVTKEERKDSQWMFGFPVPLTPNKPRVGSSTGA